MKLDVNDLKIREMKLSDRPEMERIVRNIWDGHDYMPLVYESWVNDPKGMFIAAVDKNDRLIGFEKLSMLTPNDAWIEGLRKDMSVEVKGIGRFLTHHILCSLANDSKVKTVRFATYFRNDSSIRLFSKMGFRILGRYDHKSYRLPNLKNIPKYMKNTAEVSYNVSDVMDYINRSEWKKNNPHGLCHSWVIRPFEDDMIRVEYIEKGRCVVLKKEGSIRGLFLYSEREKEDLFISMMEADDPKYFKELFQKAKQISYSMKKESICVVINPKDKKASNLFKEQNFKSWESEGDFLLFDLPVSDLKKYSGK